MRFATNALRPVPFSKQTMHTANWCRTCLELDTGLTTFTAITSKEGRERRLRGPRRMISSLDCLGWLSVRTSNIQTKRKIRRADNNRRPTHPPGLIIRRIWTEYRTRQISRNCLKLEHNDSSQKPGVDWFSSICLDPDFAETPFVGPWMVVISTVQPLTHLSDQVKIEVIVLEIRPNLKSSRLFWFNRVLPSLHTITQSWLIRGFRCRVHVFQANPVNVCPCLRFG